MCRQTCRERRRGRQFRRRSARAALRAAGIDRCGMSWLLGLGHGPVDLTRYGLCGWAAFFAARQHV